jgi:hypothetical protein
MVNKYVVVVADDTDFLSFEKMEQKTGVYV